MWLVFASEYAGEGYWYDYPPFEFQTEEEANDFASKVNGRVVRVENDAGKNLVMNGGSV